MSQGTEMDELRDYIARLESRVQILEKQVKTIDKALNLTVDVLKALDKANAEQNDLNRKFLRVLRIMNGAAVL